MHLQTYIIANGHLRMRLPKANTASSSYICDDHPFVQNKVYTMHMLHNTKRMSQTHFSIASLPWVLPYQRAIGSCKHSSASPTLLKGSPPTLETRCLAPNWVSPLVRNRAEPPKTSPPTCSCHHKIADVCDGHCCSKVRGYNLQLLHDFQKAFLIKVGSMGDLPWLKYIRCCDSCAECTWGEAQAQQGSTRLHARKQLRQCNSAHLLRLSPHSQIAFTVCCGRREPQMRASQRLQ